MDNIIVWGAGELAKLFLNNKQEKFNTVQIVEGNHSSSTPQDLNGVPIISKNEYFGSSDKNLPLYICSSFFGEICAEIRKNDISFDNIFIVFAGDYKVSIEKLTDLNPPIDEYIDGQKKCRQFYKELENDPKVETFANLHTGKTDLLSHALKQIDNPGLNLEFGVFRGDSIRFLASESKEHFWGFDSFEGLPEYWVSGHSEGVFDQKGEIPKAPENVSFVKGWFDKTLEPFLAKTKGHVSFLHMDADLYSSTIYVLEELKDRIMPGTIIVFDEYNFFLDPTFAEEKAFKEFTQNHGIKFEFISQCIHSVGIRIL